MPGQCSTPHSVSCCYEGSLINQPLSYIIFLWLSQAQSSSVQCSISELLLQTLLSNLMDVISDSIIFTHNSWLISGAGWSVASIKESLWIPGEWSDKLFIWFLLLGKKGLKKQLFCLLLASYYLLVSDCDYDIIFIWQEDSGVVY